MNQLDRAAEQLQALHEPAGADFGLRATALHSVFNLVILTFLGTPQGMKATEIARRTLAQNRPARDKALKNLQQLVQ